MYFNQKPKKCSMTAVLVPLAALGWYPNLSVEPAQAQQGPICLCEFKEAPWEAYGTKAACSTFTRKGGTSCEIEFGGISADQKLIAEILRVNPTAYNAEAYNNLITFLQYLKEGRKLQLLDPKFISTALPTFMRGAYLRGPLDDNTIQQARSLDAAIKSFFEKYSDQVSSVFRGSSPEFSTEIGNATFTVGKGYIVVKHPAGILITRYIPPEF